MWGDTALNKADVSATLTELFHDKLGGGESQQCTGCLQKGEGGTGSPLTLLPPHANLSRATQVLAKEREDQVNPD